MTKEVDDLMALDPIDLTRDDVDKIVHHYRTRRVHFEHGVKPKKEQKSSVSLEGVMKALKVQAPTQPSIKRRI